MLSICNDFLSNRRQKVMVNGATSEWIPIVFGMPQGSVLCPLLLLVDYGLYAYVDVSTLLAVVRKPADRPAVATSLHSDLTWFQEWYNHRCMTFNPNNIKASVSRSRTVDPPHGDLVLSGF